MRGSRRVALDEGRPEYTTWNWNPNVGDHRTAKNER